MDPSFRDLSVEDYLYAVFHYVSRRERLRNSTL